MIEITILVAIVVGLTEVVKRIGVDGRWLPLVAILFGISANFLGKAIGVTVPELFLGGIMAGLMGCGLWETGKHTVAGR